MEIMKISMVAIIGTVLAAVVREQRKEFGIYIALVTIIVIFGMIAAKLSSVIELIDSWKNSISFGSFYVPIILKVLGIAYISDFTAQICKDAGEGAIGGKVELAGKIMIFYIAIPVMTSIMELIGQIIP